MLYLENLTTARALARLQGANAGSVVFVPSHSLGCIVPQVIHGTGAVYAAKVRAHSVACCCLGLIHLTSYSNMQDPQGRTRCC